jgi:hypothetical protein
MKLAVMQPYFFPYIGYFQLIHAADKFVAYDDVNFIKQGWINRNFILLNCRPLRITIPLSNASSFTTISNSKLSPNAVWRSKLLKTLHQAYDKAPYFEEIYALAEAVIQREHAGSIAQLALGSIQAVVAYLGLTTQIQPTSSHYRNSHIKGQARVLDICCIEGATTYYNLPGGYKLYDRDVFATAGVELGFIQPSIAPYRQFGCEFVPNLSILDVLMFNDRATVCSYLDNYEVA